MSPADYLRIWREWQKKEASVRHSLAIFLIIYSLVGLDLFSINDEKKPEKATVGWVVWGIAFVLLANFFIGPEQEQIQVKRRYARLTNR